MALNTLGLEPRGAFVTVDRSLHELGSSLTIGYRSDWSDDQLRHQPQAETLPVQEYQGRAAVRIDLPPSGMVILS
jgi:hypothetical protein